MRELYSTQLALVVGFLILVVTGIFALIQSPATLSASIKKSMPTPHAVEGLEQCDSCHGIRGSLPYPVNHLGWSNESCTQCHLSVVESTTAPSADLPREDARKVPLTPHSGKGWDNCVACHTVDSTIRPAPSSHEGWPNTLCLACHQRADVAP